MKSPESDRPKIVKSIKKIQKVGGLEFLADLSARWADEKQYEDFADYKKAIKEKFSFLSITKITKRPFGISYAIQNSIVTYSVYSKGNGNYESKATAIGIV